MTQNKFTTNNNPTLAAVSSSDGETPVYLYADPITHGLVISAVFSGTVTTSPTFAQNPTDPTPTPAYGKVDASGIVQVAVVSGEAPVTNDGTFAKETGGNLDTIASKDFATQTTLALIKAKTDNLDVLLSTRAVTGLTDTQLRATPVPVSGTVTTSGLTDTQLRASAVPVSLATNTPTLQSGSTTAVTQATAASLNATVVGTGTFTVQLTGATNNINNIVGTVSLPTGASTATKQLPDNHNVVVTSAPTTAVTGTFFQVTQPVSATSLPLPSGASTSANQTTGNSSLSSIDTKLSGTLSITGSTIGTTSAVVNVGQKTVNTTAVQITASSTVPTNGILIGALSTNSAPIFVGGSGVTTSNGVELLAGASTPFTCNLNTLYIISALSTTDKIWWSVT